MPSALTAADWMLAAPLLWLTGAGVLILLIDALRPARLAEAVVALLGLTGAGWFVLPLLRESVSGFAAGGGAVPMLVSTPGLAALALLCLGSAFVAGALGLRRLVEYEGGRHGTAFWTLLLFCPAGMLLTLWSNHMATLFLGIETLSLPLYVLAALQRNDEHSVEAGLKYFLLGAFASGFLGFGMALVYAATGRMDAAAGQEAALGPMAAVGLGMLLIGLLFKAAIAPFHLWAADVYQGAPTPVTALMAAGTKAAAVAALFRWSPGIELLPPTAWAMLGTLTLVVGNLSALNQANLKRMLALSGVAHAGILLYALAANAAGLRTGGSGGEYADGPFQSLSFYLLAYGFASLAAFGALELLERHSGGRSDDDALRGMARRHPLPGAVLCVALLSLAGFPFTAGFLAKYFVFVELIRVGMTGWALAGILLTLLAFGYYLKALVNLFMREPGPQRPAMVPADAFAAAVLLVPAILSVVFGVWPAPLRL